MGHHHHHHHSIAPPSLTTTTPSPHLPSIKPTPATKRDHHSHHLHYIRADIEAHVYVRYILWAMHMCTCNILQAHVHVRIYIFNAPEADSAYTYTCKDIYYGLSFT